LRPTPFSSAPKKKQYRGKIGSTEMKPHGQTAHRAWSLEFLPKGAELTTQSQAVSAPI